MKQLLAALRHPRAYTWWALRPWRPHSLVLAIGGLIYIGIGSAYAATSPGVQLAAEVTSMRVWGAMFICTGVLALLSSRWPPASEKWGYSALAATSALWAAFYLLGLLFFDGPSLTGVLVWTLVTVLWVAVSALENPSERIVDDRQD